MQDAVAVDLKRDRVNLNERRADLYCPPFFWGEAKRGRSVYRDIRLSRTGLRRVVLGDCGEMGICVVNELQGLGDSIVFVRQVTF